MKPLLPNNLRKLWPVALGAFFFSLFLFKVPTDHQPLATPTYNLDRLKASSAKIPIPAFEDITIKAGINIPHTQRSEQLSGLHDSLGAGACIFDFDNDGLVDILTLNGGGTKHFFGKPQWWQSKRSGLSLYRNQDGTTFEDITYDSLLTATAETMGCNVGDLDNDGDKDIFITNRGDNQLWQNNGDGTFSDITVKANVQDGNWSSSSRFGDVNNDGLLDIYVTNYVDFTPNARVFEENAGYDQETEKKFAARLYPGQANRLYINQGAMVFIDATREFNVENSQGRGLSANFVDINHDGWLDLLVANDQGSENKVYINQRGQHFEDVSTQSRMAITTGAPSLFTAKLRHARQGGPLLFLSTKSGDHPRLFKMEKGPIVAKNISETMGLHTLGLSKTSWGGVVTDVNGDGWQDLTFANGSNLPHSEAAQVSAGQPNTLLINDQQGRFNDLSAHLNAHTYRSLSSRCVASADFDNNGAPDLFFTQNNDLPQLLLNRLPIKHWIGFDLVNLDHKPVDGAVVDVEYGGVKQTRYAGQHQGFLCASDSRLLFALDDAETIQRVQVTWPDGEAEAITGFQRNQYNRVIRNKMVKPLGQKGKPKAAVSSIRLLGKRHQLTVIGWLIDNGRFGVAKKELNRVIQEPDPALREYAYELGYRLPEALRGRFMQDAVSDNAPKIRRDGVRMIKQTEDESLIRWLIPALSDQDPTVACEAASAFEHFFREEEAVVVRKFLALDSLIQLAAGSDPETQACAARALGESEHYRALDILSQRLRDGLELVKIEAARALGLIKEKSSLDMLSAAFASPSESPDVRAASLSAMQTIDRHIDIKTFIDHLFTYDLSNQQLKDHLQILTLIAAPKDQASRISASHYLPTLVNWRRQYPGNLNPANALAYFNIIHRHQGQFTQSDIQTIRQISANDNPDIRLAAIYLLFALEPERERAKLLVSALNDPAISDQLLTNFPSIHLDRKEFYALSQQLPKAVQLTALWRVNAERHAANLEQLIVDTLSHPNVDIKLKHFVVHRMQHQPELLRALCDQSKPRNADLAGLFVTQLNGCLAENRLHKTMPAPLRIAIDQNNALGKNNSARAARALGILATRRERWAGKIIREILADSTTPLSTKETIMAALPKTISQTLARHLLDIFNQAPFSPTAALITKHRHKANPVYTEKALNALKHHIDQGNEESAMLFAHALIAAVPDRVLSIVMKQY